MHVSFMLPMGGCMHLKLFGLFRRFPVCVCLHQLRKWQLLCLQLVLFHTLLRRRFYSVHPTRCKTACQKVKSKAGKIFTLMWEHRYLSAAGSTFGVIFSQTLEYFYNQINRERAGNSKKLWFNQHRRCPSNRGVWHLTGERTTGRQVANFELEGFVKIARRSSMLSKHKQLHW